jgi:uncharacterized glyoxalase superfamily protein PhnB
MSDGWYARPVLSVRDTLIALEFYKSKLGFAEDWRYEEEGDLRIVQVSRNRCALILSDQWSEEAGHGVMFISLDREQFTPEMHELVSRGADLQHGVWGYELAVVKDPDGNRLWFPLPDGFRWSDVVPDSPTLNLP